METAQKQVILTLDLKTTEIILNAVANHYNYIVAKPIIENITNQLNEQVKDNNGDTNND